MALIKIPSLFLDMSDSNSFYISNIRVQMIEPLMYEVKTLLVIVPAACDQLMFEYPLCKNDRILKAPMALLLNLQIRIEGLIVKFKLDCRILQIVIWSL